MTVITEPAPAKINLTLEVQGRRTDGYHELSSLVVFARDACDIVELQPGAATSLTVQGPFAPAIVGENIMQRAIDMLARHRLKLGALRLDKRLPIASGIGGGSADVAALLRAVRTVNPHFDEPERWAEIAAALGADVPVCLSGMAARMTGTGTDVEPIARFPTLHAVLANPLAAVPADKTVQVFRALALPPGSAPGKMAMSQAPRFSQADDAMAYIMARENQLTAAASQVVPAAGTVLAALAQLPGCRVARMSGAGPTCFALFDTAEAASTAATALKNAHPTWWVAPSRLD